VVRGRHQLAIFTVLRAAEAAQSRAPGVDAMHYVTR